MAFTEAFAEIPPRARLNQAGCAGGLRPPRRFRAQRVGGGGRVPGMSWPVTRPGLCGARAAAADRAGVAGWCWGSGAKKTRRRTHRSGSRTPRLAGGCGPSGSRPTSPTSPAPGRSCSGSRSPGGPARRSPAGSMHGVRAGRTRSGSWPSTRARSTGPPWSRDVPAHEVIITGRLPPGPPRQPGRHQGPAAGHPPGPGRRGTGRDPAWANHQGELLPHPGAAHATSSSTEDVGGDPHPQEATGGLLATWIKPRRSCGSCCRWPALARRDPRMANRCRLLRLVRPRRRPRSHHPGPHDGRPGGREILALTDTSTITRPPLRGRQPG